MKITISSNARSAGRAAAEFGAEKIRAAIKTRGSAAIIVATGASQFAMLDTLVALPEIAWEKVTAFHLDEYVGLPITHKASFRGYLWDRFHRMLPRPLKAMHYVAGDEDPKKEKERLAGLIKRERIAVCFAGIGENGHLAFNDPPADFKTSKPYLVVKLDEACRRQQFGEGWFPSLRAVPEKAISMSIRQILASETILITAPDKRKAEAVRNTIEGEVSPLVPASILQRHPDTHLFLDKNSASLLSKE